MTDFHPPINPPVNGRDGETVPTKGLVTFAAVEERLVEAMLLWRRMPGGGRWPFAGDGPWHLVRKEWWDYDARDPAKLRRMPPTREQIAEMNEATEWLTWIGERDRRMVVMALTARAAGRKGEVWMPIWKALGRGRPGPDGLRKRYSAAISAIARRLSR